MMETSSIMMVAHQPANWNVVMDSKLEMRNAIWDPKTLMLPTNVNLPADFPDVVMDMLTPLRNVIMLLLANLLPPAETPANGPTVEMALLMLFMVRIVITDLVETAISPLLAAPLVAHKIVVVSSILQHKETSTEPWLVQVAFTHMLVHPPDPHAVDQSNG